MQKTGTIPYRSIMNKICKSSTWLVEKSKLQRNSNPTVAEPIVERKKKVEVVQFAGYNAVPLLDFSSTVNLNCQRSMR